MSLTLRHAPPPPLSTLVEVRRGGGARAPRRRAIGALHGCTLEFRRAADAPADESHCVLDARVSDASAAGRPAISLVLAAGGGGRSGVGRRLGGGGVGGIVLKVYLFTRKKHAAWIVALRAAARWKVESFYGFAEGGGVYGVGLFAEVRRAVALDGGLEGEEVAVKLVQNYEQEGGGVGATPVHPQLAEFMRREARICRILAHPDVVEVYDVFESPTALSIVMRVYPLTLQEYVAERGPLHEAAAAATAAAVLRALLYLHDADIVHRDVNPSNVLLTAPVWPFDAVLCDFGLANFVDRRAARVRSAGLRRAAAAAPGARAVTPAYEDAAALDGCTFTSAVGAPAYVAPEVVERARYGAPVDAWGVGVLLFHALSGRLPFGGDDARDPAAALDAVREARLVFEGDVWLAVSAPARDLIRALLNPDPRRRLSVEAALMHPWIVAPPLESTGAGVGWHGVWQGGDEVVVAAAAGPFARMKLDGHVPTDSDGVRVVDEAAVDSG